MLPFFTFPLQLPLIFLYIFFKNTYYKAYSNKEGFGFKLYLPLYNLDPCNRIYAPYRPWLSYFQGMKLYKNYSTLIYNYPIFQRLGLDPSYVHIHKYITEKNKSIIKSWDYGDVNYYIVTSDINSLTLSNLQDFIKSSFTSNAVYAVLPILVNDMVRESERFISLGGQLVMTRLVNPISIMNRIESNIEKLIPYYGFKGKLYGTLCFKWRVISYDLQMIKHISTSIPHTSTQNIHTFDKNYTFHDIIPMTFNLDKYGTIIKKDFILNNYKVEGVHYKYSDDICIFIHSNKENSRKLTIFKKDILYAECSDILEKDTLIRRYDYGLNLYIDNKNETLKYFERQIECLPISKVKRHFSKDVIISAFDIEAYSDKLSNGIFIAYAVGYINPNKEVYTYYLSDFENSKDMLKKCLIDMLLSKPQLGTVYVHNLSRFDTFFIDPIILNDCDIIGKYLYNKDGKVLSIKVSFKTGKGSFIFRDSILMTQGSLLSLALNFNSSIIKKNFPHNYVTRLRLNYIGIKPDMSYYENISLEEYNSIPDNWNLREELLKYLTNDLSSLQDIMVKFAEDIYKLEGLNITNIATTSSLAFKALFKNYVKPNLFYKVKAGPHNDMRRGFFGGITEVYYLNPKGKLRIYDINSSYPASMKQAMPVGKPIMSNDRILDNYFGVVYAKIKTPIDGNGHYIKLKYPPLPYRKSSSIINPIGSWTGMYCSELLKFVRDVYNYEIEVLYGYKYERGLNCFAGFVDKYYDIKSGVNKDTSINRATAKLLLNGAFGRAGLKHDETVIEIVDSITSKKLQEKYDVKRIIEYTPNVHWVKYERIVNSFYIEGSRNIKDNSIERLKENNRKLDVDSCLPIAIFTTAYSTIRLFQAIRWIEESGKEVYAVDTDSIHTNAILPDELLGNDLGKFKLEFQGHSGGLYPLPKTYYAEGNQVNDKEKSEFKIIKKGKGVKGGSLLKEEYLKLVQGIPVQKNDPRFIIKRQDSSIRLKDVKIEIKADFLKRNLVKKGDEIRTSPLIIEEDSKKQL